MRAGVACLIVLLVASPAVAQSSEHTPSGSRGHLFWTGLAVGIAGVTMSVIAVTVARVDDASTGNAPPGTFQACVAQQSDPIYATNNCDELRPPHSTTSSRD